jgi:hypothetical protein
VELSKKQQDKIRASIDAVWTQPKNCEVCGKLTWKFQNRIWELRDYNEERGGGVVIRSGGAVVPVVAIMCETCGNIRLMNAIYLGMVDHATGKVTDG